MNELVTEIKNVVPSTGESAKIKAAHTTKEGGKETRPEEVKGEVAAA